MSYLTIVMYHYVRDLKKSRFPEIKGLDSDLFKQQLKYIKKYYTVVSASEVMDAVECDSKLPPRSLLLTFDDGYSDHFQEVFPILANEGLSGCFFPPAKCILDNEVLGVNKIHFILASIIDKPLPPTKTDPFLPDRIDPHREHDLESAPRKGNGRLISRPLLVKA